MNLADIRKFTAQLAPRILVHGQEGVGKTTLASKFPPPIFLQAEDGCPGSLEIDSFGLIENFADLRSAIGALASEQHHFQTVVLDSLDAPEKLIWRDACRSQGWASIERPGYGKGTMVKFWWVDILKGLDFLRRQLGMSIVLLAYSAIETINDPRAASLTLPISCVCTSARAAWCRTGPTRSASSRRIFTCRPKKSDRQEAQPRRRRIATLAALRGTTKLRRREPLRPAGQNAGAEEFQLRGARSVPAALRSGASTANPTPNQPNRRSNS